MSIFAVGDLHLSRHPNIHKPMDIFGEPWKQHMERLEEHWNNEIKPEDTIILAGDISWGLRLQEAVPDLEWINKLPGKKVIIKGNHDLWWNKITALNKMYDTVHFLQNHCYLADGYAICGSRGWICPGDRDFKNGDLKIYRREVMRVERSLAEAKQLGVSKIIGVTHFPPTNEKFEETEFTKLFESYGAEQVLYGHLHGEEGFNKGIKGLKNNVKYDLVSLDYLECKPKKVIST